MPTSKPDYSILAATRRDFLNRCGMGFGAIALQAMLAESGAAAPALADRATATLQPRLPPLPATAKRVIHLFMSGGPSHIDTFDPKPALARFAGKKLGPGAGRMPAQVGMPSPFKFTRHGNSGLEISELFPNIGAHADEMCVI